MGVDFLELGPLVVLTANMEYDRIKGEARKE